VNGCIGVTLPGRSPKSFDWITPTVRSRPATTPSMQTSSFPCATPAVRKRLGMARVVAELSNAWATRFPSKILYLKTLAPPHQNRYGVAGISLKLISAEKTPIVAA
jgi:hypothetical protein